MAVKTSFSQHDFAAILANYDLGDYRDSRPFSDGTVQTNLLVTTTKGDFVLKYYERRALESVRFETNLIDYILQKSYPCAAPFKNRYGVCVGLYKQKPYVFFEYIEGHHVEHPTAQQQRQIIHTAATLQVITRSYKPRLRQFRQNYNLDTCLRLVQAEARKLDTDNAWAKLKWFEHECARISLPQSLPKGICHCDYDLSNILFNDGDLAALLDFDDANYTYLTFDLVNLIDGWAWPHQQDDLILDDARRIVQGYAQVRGLSDFEKRYLFDVHKLQIMFDGIWFFARGHADDFYERRKIASLDALGRDGYYRALFT